ncbi:MAG: ribonuclease E activity regulator RraA [Bifidobacteriaceae bacterium]|jgi:regulator of ribonuclease activity A|nr:ribonuclease E activity regulator RraA [Bifidobacteriaceae bacterium]
MAQSTPDLCDEFPDIVRVMAPGFINYGGHEAFSGLATTVKCFEDNSLVKHLAGQPGEGRVMVVDGGGSLRQALLGDLIAGEAARNGWAGFVISGAVRDVEVLRTLPIGIRALGAVPVKTEKRGLGDMDVPVEVGGLVVEPGQTVIVDATGIAVMPAEWA